MKMRIRLGLVLASAAVTLVGQAVWAKDWFKHRCACESTPCVHSCEAPSNCRICNQVPSTKKVTKTVYQAKEEWYCLTKCPCPLHIGKHNCCDPCGKFCTTCDKPRCRRILVKKIITADEPTTKCVVEE